MKDIESNICQIAAIKEGRLVLSESYHGYSITAPYACISFPGYFTRQQDCTTYVIFTTLFGGRNRDGIQYFGTDIQGLVEVKLLQAHISRTV